MRGVADDDAQARVDAVAATGDADAGVDPLGDCDMDGDALSDRVGTGVCDGDENALIETEARGLVVSVTEGAGDFETLPDAIPVRDILLDALKLPLALARADALCDDDGEPDARDDPLADSVA
jgi:hypothetical protein